MVDGTWVGSSCICMQKGCISNPPGSTNSQHSPPWCANKGEQVVEMVGVNTKRQQYCTSTEMFYTTFLLMLTLFMFCVVLQFSKVLIFPVISTGWRTKIWRSDLAGDNGAWRDSISLIAILIYSYYIWWSKVWTYCKYDQDLFHDYIEMKFRIYPTTKF